MKDEIKDSIIRQAITGDNKAFEQVYHHYAPFVWKVVFRTASGDTDAATHIVQDTFIKVHSGLRKYRFNSQFSTWLYRIAFTTAMTFLSRRRHWWNRFSATDADTLGTQANDGEHTDLIHHILAQLTPEERFLLVAREVNDVPFEELAEITGKSSGSLRVQVLRIKESLRGKYHHEYQ
jgi:RNA polymerase sigma-70 factor (ECF subfamily)